MAPINLHLHPSIRSSLHEAARTLRMTDHDVVCDAMTRLIATGRLERVVLGEDREGAA